MFDLETLEGTVRTGLKSFIEVGDALTKIREGNGFKLRGFDSFDNYVEKTFGFSVRHGQRLIAAAETARHIERLTGETPANESVTREINRVAFSPAAVQEVQTELKKTGSSIGTAGAKAVAKVVTSVLNKESPLPPSLSPGPAKPSDSKPATTKPTAQFIPEQPMPEVITMPGSEFCPSCGLIPDAYTRQGHTWRCGECGGKVILSVSSEALNG